MHPTTFDLSRFRNRNGTTSWRVSGYLAGIRIRRNFKTREEAAVGKTALHLQAIQSAAGGVRMVSTFLTDRVPAPVDGDNRHGSDRNTEAPPAAQSCACSPACAPTCTGQIPVCRPRASPSCQPKDFRHPHKSRVGLVIHHRPQRAQRDPFRGPMCTPPS